MGYLKWCSNSSLASGRVSGGFGWVKVSSGRIPGDLLRHGSSWGILASEFAVT